MPSSSAARGAAGDRKQAEGGLSVEIQVFCRLFNESQLGWGLMYLGSVRTDVLLHACRSLRSYLSVCCDPRMWWLESLDKAVHVHLLLSCDGVARVQSAAAFRPRDGLNGIFVH